MPDNSHVIGGAAGGPADHVGLRGPDHVGLRGPEHVGLRGTDHVGLADSSQPLPPLMHMGYASVNRHSGKLMLLSLGEMYMMFILDDI